ncbi:MAP kinase-activated protein kinase 5-like [Lytechinus pictus]|uniref:MAP kinase-activated protein kinase 5-like n=1 Tax=Lytechinus pictus TaxID=7653 RepID=UPI0030B9E54D
MSGQPVKIKTVSILEEYTIDWTQKLGTGINGPVRPCQHKISEERFALKLLTDKPSARAEVNLHSRCSGHPNIVKIVEVYSNEVQFPGEPAPRSRLLVVMELMDGGELFDRISKQKRFTERQAVILTKQIASAVLRCHNLNIAHRDLKPENLLLKDNSEDSPVKLSDFGFAKVDDGTLMTPHFTPYYVAPQVLEAQKRQRREQKNLIQTSPRPYTYDKGCDMWSLGVIIYIMLCGYPPFYPDTPSRQLSKDMRHKIMAGQYEFPTEEWSLISDEAKDVVKRLLKVDPSERLNIEELCSHPWLKENSAPNTELHSPAIMLDRNMLDNAKQAHSEQLTAMRIPEKKVTLKPVAKANNPIVRKRIHSRGHSIDNKTGEEQPSKKQNREISEGLRCLRNVIAHCVVPPKDTNGEDALCELMKRACEYNTDCPSLDKALHSLSWNGEQFCHEVDHSELALLLKDIVDQKERHGKH